MRRLLTPAIATIAALFPFAGLAGGASSPTVPDTEICRGYTGDMIAACDRVIASRSSTREQVGDAYINRGQHHYEAKEYDKAIADFDRAIPLKPRWVEMAYGNRGNAYYAKNQYQDALDNYTKAIAINPKYTSALTARGLCYEHAGDIERAKADYEAALAADSIFADNGWAHETARKHLDALASK